MLSKLRNRLTFANVVSMLALFVALGGSSYAAIKITGKNVKDNSLTTKDIKNKSLLKKDFKSGQLPAGAKGAKGDKGDPGAPNPNAANSDKLDGADSTAFVSGGGTAIRGAFTHFAGTGSSDERTFAVPGYGELKLSCEGASYALFFKNTTSGPLNVWASGELFTNPSTSTVVPPERHDVASNITQALPSPGAGNTPGDIAREQLGVAINTEGLPSSHVANLTVFLEHQRGGTPAHATCRSAVSGVLAP